MNPTLVRALKTKDYPYILTALQPLFYKHLQGIDPNLREDFLQEYYILCVELVKKTSWSTTPLQDNHS